jgi:hypothetical protein
MLSQHVVSDPKRPFFFYGAFGATHTAVKYSGEAGISGFQDDQDPFRSGFQGIGGLLESRAIERGPHDERFTVLGG